MTVFPSLALVCFYLFLSQAWRLLRDRADEIHLKSCQSLLVQKGPEIMRFPSRGHKRHCWALWEQVVRPPSKKLSERDWSEPWGLVQAPGCSGRITDLRDFCSSREAFAWVWRKLVYICTRKINTETLLLLEYVFRVVWIIASKSRPLWFDMSSIFYAFRVCFHTYLSFVSP